jgi:hypothetical protein
MAALECYPQFRTPGNGNQKQGYDTWPQLSAPRGYKLAQVVHETPKTGRITPIGSIQPGAAPIEKGYVKSRIAQPLA